MLNIAEMDYMNDSNRSCSPAMTQFKTALEIGRLNVYVCLTGKNLNNATTPHPSYLQSTIDHQFSCSLISPKLNLAINILFDDRSI